MRCSGRWCFGKKTSEVGPYLEEPGNFEDKDVGVVEGDFHGLVEPGKVWFVIGDPFLDRLPGGGAGPECHCY